MNADGTALDNQTGATWQVGQAPSPLNESDALNYCANLSLAGSGWSLPTINQLKTLITGTVDSKSGCYIDGCVFGTSSCAVTDLFWSSSPDTNLAGYALLVDFNTTTGNNPQFEDPSYTYAVRCVR